MSTETFTINGAAEFLKRDRRSVAKALANVTPDMHDAGRPRWTLARISAAMAAYDRDWSGASGRDHRHRYQARDADIRALEIAATQCEASLRRIAAEPDVGKRRELFEQIGLPLGDLDRAFRRCNDALDHDGRTVGEVFADHTVRQVLAQPFELLEFTPTEIAAFKAEAA